MRYNQKHYKVGIYVRLSKEDSRSGESVSIENQKLMLTKHVDEMGWEQREVYQDDGFSGTNQHRPAFKRMIADVEAGRINTLLIKDLSRLGRNYLEVGRLAEVFLPEHGCELVSLSEKLDDMMVFRNWFNEQHSKSTSAKVRAGKRISAQRGKHMGAYAPYGYRKDPQNRHKLIIDEAAAPIVRNIFQMRAAGTSFRQIAVKLNENGITSPREHYYRHKGVNNPRITSKLWSDSTVKDVLKNEVYRGVLVSGKSGTISYKNQRQVRKDSSEWIRVEGTHEALVDTFTWERVQALAAKKHRPRKRNDGATNLFTSILFCGGCGFRLKGQAERRTRRNGSVYKNVSYMCSTFARSGRNACTSHCIGENTLKWLVAQHLRACAETAAIDEAGIANSIMSHKGRETFSYRAAYEHELAGHTKLINKLDTLVESLYADRVSGLIPESLFKRQIAKYEQEREERSLAVSEMRERLEGAEPAAENAPDLAGLIRQYADMDVLCCDYVTLVTLIDKIVVGEPMRIAGRKLCDIEIVYNFAGSSDVAGA
ncbi:MAG: recombinase family protein [Defluviitaleaceae bacterium]|nr:recombinase family protein [Defluviitaleaceae bacterium]